jgi:hypothetical protein
VAWITARDGSRAPGDLEDQAARYHPGRHELTINGDFRAITEPGRWFAHEFELPTVRARKALVHAVEPADELAVALEREVDLLTFAERRDFADALPRATWSAVLAKARVLLLGFLTATDAAAIWQARR